MMNQSLLKELSKITPEEKKILAGDQEIQKSLYTDSADFTIESNKMLPDDLIRMRPHTRFISFPKHRHNYVEFFYMCQGQATHIINDQTVITLKAGDLLLMNQHTFHEILKTDEQDIGVNFFIRPSFFDMPLSMIQEESILSKFLFGTLRQNTSEVNYLHFQVADVLPIQNLVENMVWTFLNESQESQKTLQMTMGLLFMELLKQTQRIIQNDVNQYENGLVMAALQYIEQQYHDASLSVLAKKLNQPVSALSRLLKNATGQTFTQLLQQQRLHRAEYLLTQSELSVSDIIEAVGYSNTSYFYRLFQQQYGVSPFHYRKKG
jgi:AraC family L-rhamnose operon regulatory protein RhaS